MKLSILAMSTLLLAGTAQAGPYLVLEAGQARGDFDLNDFKAFNQSVIDAGGTASLDDDDTDTALSLGGGYRLNNHFAVELAYMDLGEYSARSDTQDTVDGFDRERTIEERLELSGLALQAIGRWPINNLALEGSAGLIRLDQDGSARAEGQTFDNSGTVVDSQSTRSSADDSETVPMFGVGVSYQFTDQLQAQVRYRRMMNIDSDLQDEYDLDLFTAGIGFLF